MPFVGAVRSLEAISNIVDNDGSENNIAGDIVAEANEVRIWDGACKVLQATLDFQIFSAWIKPLIPSRINLPLFLQSSSPQKLEITLLAPNKFYCDHIKRAYGDLICSAIAESCSIVNLNKNNIELLLSVSGNGNKLRSAREEIKNDKVKSAEEKGGSCGEKKSLAFNSSSSSSRANNARVTKTSLAQANLNPKYSFANFVVGACNQLGHAVGKSVAEQPGCRYNPLFVYGGVGLGKTHLVNAIGNFAWRKQKKVLFVSSEVFVNELIQALKSNKMSQFKEKFRSLDVLIIDDVQFIAGKERTQEELFHTFNSLYAKQSQIILTADKIPQELVTLEERLRTRFACGLTVDLQAPDFETRVAILMKKAEALNISLPPEVAKLLAEKIDSNVRELEGALNRFNAMSALNGQNLNIDLVESALRTIVPEKSRAITIELIQKTVAEKYGMSVRELVGKRRNQSVVLPRQIAMYLCRKLTTCSFPEIGALFGGRDHSTVVYAIRSIDERKHDTNSITSDLRLIESRLTGTSSNI